jgi:ABC-type glycerol-3-phosphate transport system permease component
MPQPERRSNLEHKVRRWISQGLAYFILAVWTAFAFYAVGWVFLSSVSTTREIFSNTLLRSGTHLENYVKALTTHSMGLYFIPFTLYFLTGFFGSLPREMEESARIDGCTDVQAFWRIMLPLAQPAIVTVTIFNFMGLWNEYF